MFTDDAMVAAADGALFQGTGARALRSILEQTLLDVMYELPSLSQVTKCIVDADAIRGDAEVRLADSGDQQVPFAPLERKSA